MVRKANDRPRYKLADLLAQCDFSLPESAEARELADASPVEREWGSRETMALEEELDPEWVTKTQELYDAAG